MHERIPCPKHKGTKIQLFQPISFTFILTNNVEGEKLMTYVS